MLIVLIVTGLVADPLAFSHGIAVVLVIQAFLLDWRAASLRILLAAVLTTASAATHATSLHDVAIQVPFVYGLAGLVVLLADSLRRSRGAAARLALYDALTDLPNRVLFGDRVEHALRVAGRDGSSVALLLMDLDRFKEVNDTFGHHAGDVLLGQVGPHLHDELRAGDTLARLGGDEFALLLPGAGAAVAASVAERVLGALAKPFVVDGQQLTIGASIGIACSPEHANDAETLLRRADVAMYVAKRGRGAWAAYAPDQEEEERGVGRLALMSELASAIDAGQLSLRYQPQIDAATGRVVAFEALTRWEHPVRGLIGPDEFIPIAERGGTIHRLTERALAEAIQQARSWRDDGVDARVAVNISTRDLLEEHMPDRLRVMLERDDLPPDRLILEITESGLMADQERAVRTVTRLRALGVGVSIDDFGSGYASIAYLRRLCPTEVKIDRSFVAALATDPDAEGIVRATIDIAHVLGLTVVAEGVEDPTARDRLSRLGADRLQGYVFARPMAASDIGAYLRRADRSRDVTAVTIGGRDT
jgi:diguanylate cyclase (GGDEF)-like protein